MKNVLKPLTFCLLLTPFSTVAEIEEGNNTGSLTLKTAGITVIYNDITGDKNGFFRSLLPINGSNGLIALGRGEHYYTLNVHDNQIQIDCIYINDRNNQNGANISAAVCDSNTTLNPDYTDISQNLSNFLTQSIYSFDTSPVMKGLKSRFMLGKIGAVEIYDAYDSEDDLINSRPAKYIKTKTGCRLMKEANAFLVFINPQARNPSYLDVIKNLSPMTIERLDEQELAKMATDQCD